MAPSLPALPPPPSSSHPIHVPPPTSSSSVSSPSVVSSTPGAPQPSSMSSSSAKLQYQRLRSVPQRFQSPHPPLKTKSLCSRRGSAHFSSVESEVWPWPTYCVMPQTVKQHGAALEATCAFLVSFIDPVFLGDLTGKCGISVPGTRKQERKKDGR